LCLNRDAKHNAKASSGLLDSRQGHGGVNGDTNEGLHTLKLNGNPLRTVPSIIWDLTSLRYLHLQKTGLGVLPRGVGNLTSLQELHLQNNQLSTLPAEVGNLTSLQYLDLHNNQLSTLPPALGNLPLQQLDLSRNSFIREGESGQVFDTVLQQLRTAGCSSRKYWRRRGRTISTADGKTCTPNEGQWDAYGCRPHSRDAREATSCSTGRKDA
jgi:hypothetical protein